MKFRTSSKERWLKKSNAWFVVSSHTRPWNANLAINFSASTAKSNFTMAI